jgi:hypothetical protein
LLTKKQKIDVMFCIFEAFIYTSNTKTSCKI